MAILTLVIAVFTYLVWKVYERIAALTGAMESHSEIMLRIEAIRGAPNGKQIEMVWWDPTIETPPLKKEHGQPAKLERIYLYIPPALRQNKPSFWTKLRELFRLP